MGQLEILNLLAKVKRPMGRGEIAETLNEHPTKTSKILNKLLKHQEVKCIELDKVQSAKLLGMNHNFRKTRFYYIETFSDLLMIVIVDFVAFLIILSTL